MKSVLLLRPDKGGDAVKTLPVLHALAGRDLDIHILASRHNGSLFASEPGVTVHELPAEWEHLPAEEAVRVALRELRPFDSAVNLLCDPTDATFRLLAAIPAKSRYQARHPSFERVGLSPPLTLIDLPGGTPAGKPESENIAYLVGSALSLSLTPAVLSQSDPAPRLLESDREEAREAMGEKRGRWLGFCPLAGTHQRTPPLGRWRALFDFAQQIAAEGDRLFLFAGPSEASSLVSWPAALCQASSFRALGAYLERLDGVVAVDSGPLHLARALDVPSLGFLSGGDRKRWFPEQSGHRIVPRGLITRFPLGWEMKREYRDWWATRPGPDPSRGVF